MTSRDFCFWLQGFFEINDTTHSFHVKDMNEAQVDCVRRHLALVFKHEIDPSMGDQAHQDELNAIHSAEQAKIKRMNEQPTYRPHIPVVLPPSHRDEDGGLLRC